MFIHLKILSAGNATETKRICTGVFMQLHHRCLYRQFCAALLLGFFVTMGCARERVKVDLNNFLQNQEGYRNKEVIVTASLADISERYQLYRDKKIEITAPVSYYGSKGFWTWYLVLEQGTITLRCYTHYYRIQPDISAINLLLRAKSKSGAVTVEGILKKDGLDLERIIYEDQLVRTNFRTMYIYSKYPVFFYPYKH